MYVCVLGLILAGNTIPRENFEVYHLPCFSDLPDEWQLSGPMAELTGHSQLDTNIPPFEGKQLKHSPFLSLYFWFFFFKVCLAPNGEQTEVEEQEKGGKTVSLCLYLICYNGLTEDRELFTFSKPR